MFVTSRNYAVYQSKLDEARRKGYFLPLLPVLLSDLVKANLMPDEVKECRYSYCLNFNKYRILYKVFSLIWNCQHTSPIFSTDIELSNILRAAVMQIQMNEAELNDLSQAREPSSKKNSEKYRPSSMPGDEFNHLPKFADFAKGDNSQLDAVSIQKYVTRMIDARDTLSAENADLREQLREAKIKIHALQQHLVVIRGHTIGFILEQMNTLHIETKESQL